MQRSQNACGPIVLGIAVFVFASAGAVWPAWSQNAVPIDFPGARDTFPFGISPNGDISGSYIDQQGQRHAFTLDRHGVYTSIDLPDVILTIAAGKLTPAGTTAIGTFVAPGTLTSFLRDRNGRLTPVHVPASIGFLGTIATGVNPGGQVVGWYFDAVGIHGYLLDDGVYTTIDVPGADHTRAIDITPQGDILGIYQSARWSTCSCSRAASSPRSTSPARPRPAIPTASSA